MIMYAGAGNGAPPYVRKDHPHLSICKTIGPIPIPPVKHDIDEKLRMIPIYLSNIRRFTDEAAAARWGPTFDALYAAGLDCIIRKDQQVIIMQNPLCFLTIAQDMIKQGRTHRHGGPHVDGNYHYMGEENRPGWKPHPMAINNYCNSTGGALVATSEYGMKVWEGKYFQDPDPERGDCSHMQGEMLEMSSYTTDPGVLYWMNSMCIHESPPAPFDCERTFIRLTLPPESKWIE